MLSYSRLPTSPVSTIAPIKRGLKGAIIKSYKQQRLVSTIAPIKRGLKGALASR